MKRPTDIGLRSEYPNKKIKLVHDLDKDLILSDRMDNYNIPEVGESSSTAMVVYKAPTGNISNIKIKNNSNTVVYDSKSTNVGQNSSTLVESKNESSSNTNVESNSSLNTNVESNNTTLESINENIAGELIKGDNVPLELNDSTVREFFNSSNALLQSSSSSNQTPEVIHKTMHGTVQLPDNCLPNLHGYPKPVDYQDLIGQYCDLWNNSKDSISHEVFFNQLYGFRGSLAYFIDWIEDRTNRDLAITNYYREQLYLGDQKIRDASLDKVIDEMYGVPGYPYQEPDRVSSPDSTLGNVVDPTVPRPPSPRPGDLPAIFQDWDPSCLWDFIDYLNFF